MVGYKVYVCQISAHLAQNWLRYSKNQLDIQFWITLYLGVRNKKTDLVSALVSTGSSSVRCVCFDAKSAAAFTRKKAAIRRETKTTVNATEFHRIAIFDVPSLETYVQLRFVCINVPQGSHSTPLSVIMPYQRCLICSSLGEEVSDQIPRKRDWARIRAGANFGSEVGVFTRGS